MRQTDRLAAILSRLSEDGGVGVTDLARELAASPATVRRDLRLLEQQRLLSRTHGGAVAHGVLYELPLRYRGARHGEEKRRIATAAAERVDEGMVVGLTGGTTTTEVARALSEMRRLTIVTNSLSIAAELAVRPNLKLVLTGGVARPESYELIGPLAEATLSELNLDVAIVGVDGISARDGLTTHHESEAATNRALIGRAERTIVVTDSSKVGRTAFARIVAVGAVKELITDPNADADELARLGEAGISVSTV
jgi:DeoR family transcriptional regulator, aga operon transcriptional repressor